MYRRAVDGTADEYKINKIFMYVDKIYSDFKKKRNSELGLLGKNRVSGDGKKGLGKHFKIEIGVMVVLLLIA